MRCPNIIILWTFFSALLFSSTLSGQCISTFPYFEDFNSGAGNWAKTSVSSPFDWYFGPISKTRLKRNSNCWHIDSISSYGYPNFNDSHITSPCFDFSGLTNPEISLDIFYETSYRAAGFALFSSLNNGTTWQLVGSDTTGINWYNQNRINGSPGSNIWGSGNQTGWAGSAGFFNGKAGWVTAKHDLTSLGGRNGVLLRIYFGSDSSTPYGDGAAFDNIEIKEKKLVDLGPDVTLCGVGTPHTFTAQGTGAQSYLWNTGDTTQNITVTTQGVYSVEVTLPGGIERDTVLLTYSNIIAVDLEPDTIVCEGSDVSLIAGTWPGTYMLDWQVYDSLLVAFVPAVPPILTLPQSTAAVVVMVTDLSNGCLGSDTVNVTLYKPDVDIISVPLGGCNDGVDLVAGISSVLGPSIYSYLWSNGVSGTRILNGVNFSGQYIFHAIDFANGCEGVDTFDYWGPIYLNSPFTTPDFGSSDGSASVTAFGGAPPYTYRWLHSGNTTSSETQLDSGWYQIEVTDNSPCADTFDVYIPYATAVYPGDCNHDQVANMQDLLPIGIKHGMTGPLRPGASLAWTPQVAPLWGDTLANGKDIRHVDSDGNGTINDDDTLAINLNFGMTHNNQRGSAASGIPLLFDMPTTNLMAGDTIIVPIELGTIDTPAVNFYGMAFSIQYDTSKVAENGFTLDFSSSWVGTQNLDILAMYRDDYPAGRVDIGIVRNDQTNRSGFGKIADAVIVMDDHIAKRDIPFVLSFSAIYAIDMEEEKLLVRGVSGEANITTGLADFAKTIFQVYPNPASDFVEISHKELKGGNIKLMDLHGRTLREELVDSSGKTRMEVSGIAKGIYLIQVESQGRVFVEKVSLR